MKRMLTDDDQDIFDTLGVDNESPAARGDALLESIEDEVVETIETVDEIVIGNDEDDVDPFEELGADKPKTVVDLPLGKDPLDALMDEDDDYVEPSENVFGDNEKSTKPKASSEEMYRLLLESIWADDILDPAEVALMARKRVELNVDFGTHLKLLREVLEE